MRCLPVALLAVLLLATLVGGGVSGGALVSASAEDEALGTERVWDGYLFQDEEGRVNLGWPVIAMGVMAMPAHVVEGDLAKRLAPLLTDVKGSYVFWNYTLEERGDGPLDGIPRALVRLRGRVTLERPEDPNMGSYQGGTRMMQDARLLSVEFLEETWLRRWAGIFRDPDSPFRIDMDRGPIADEALQAFAKKALGILLSMREIPRVGEIERKRAHAIDAEARVVETHRTQSEWNLQRWLLDMKAKHPDLDLAGLEALPPLPPSSVELQRFFLGAETKAAFLASVRKAWKGDLGLLALSCYERDGRSTSWVQVDLEEIEKHWSEEVYVTRRRTMQEVVGR